MHPHTAPLAFTGDDLEREWEIAAALVAGGWVIHYWSARKGPLEPWD